MDSHADISVAHWLSIAVQLAENGGSIIRKIWESGELGQE